MTPRPYQIHCRDAVLQGWAAGKKRLLVVKPTGAGKTITAALIARSLLDAGARVLFLAHREELLFQTVDKFRRSFGIEAHLEKAEHRAHDGAECVVGSVQTFAARGERFDRDAFDYIIVDEAHHVLAGQFRFACDLFPEAKIVGVTATPHRGDQRNLGEFFEDVAFELGLFELVEDGYLVPIQVRSLPLAIDVSGLHSARGDFDQPELGAILDPYLDEIARLTAEHAVDELGLRRKTIAFLPLVATSLKFVAACRKHGLNAEHIDGESTDRRAILKRFAAGEIELLANSQLLTEGFDDVGISCVLPLRLTRSQALYSQMIGRGTRPLAGIVDNVPDAATRRRAIRESAKPDLLLFDFLWQHKRHRLCRPASLIAKSDEEADAITELAQQASAKPVDVAGTLEQVDLSLTGLQTQAQAQREEALRKKLEAARKLKHELLTADEFAVEHGRADLAGFEGRMGWELADVTPAQDQLLRRAGIAPASVRGFQHAAQLLDILRFRSPIRMASEGQRRLMSRMHWRSADGQRGPSEATAADAAQFFQTLKAKQRPRGRVAEPSLI